MVWCSSVRRFCFCSLRRTRTETRCEGWNVSFLISCFQGTREREDNGQMRGRMIAAMTKLGLITHRGQNDDWHQWFQSTDASLKYKLSPPSRTGGSFKPHRMGFPKCPCRVRARKAQLNQRQITHKCCWVKSNLKDACKTTAFASASRFWIRNMLCILFILLFVFHTVVIISPTPFKGFTFLMKNTGRIPCWPRLVYDTVVSAGIVLVNWWTSSMQNIPYPGDQQCCFFFFFSRTVKVSESWNV